MMPMLTPTVSGWYGLFNVLAGQTWLTAAYFDGTQWQSDVSAAYARSAQPFADGGTAMAWISGLPS